MTLLFATFASADPIGGGDGLANPQLCPDSFSRGWCGDGGPATGALLNNPHQVTPLSTGGFLIADTGNHVIRMVDADGIISTVAGTPMTFGDTGDGGPATAATLDQPMGVADLGGGAFAIADTGNHVVRVVDAAGAISTLGPEGGLEEPRALVLAANGDLLVADAALDQIFRLSPAGAQTTVAGIGTGVDQGNTGPATSAELSRPTSVAVDPAGDLLIADSGHRSVRRVGPDGTITTIADASPGSAAPGLDDLPVAVGFAEQGNPLIGDGPDVDQLGGDGLVQRVAGTKRSGFDAEIGEATDVALASVSSIAAVGDGSTLISDSGNDRIRTLYQDGTLATVAGSGDPQSSRQIVSAGSSPSRMIAQSHNTGACSDGKRSVDTFNVSFPYARPGPIHARRGPVAISIYAAGDARLVLTITDSRRPARVLKRPLRASVHRLRLGNLGPGTYHLAAEAVRRGAYSCATAYLRVTR